ncbi:pectate lyase family protein [Nocardiopsis changdeensis]|uniref:Right-handed parallel beta-helix repeat-containing protein n=1 Tax=Nocardiopsis changdeensis TaxID=2831969 RepID=A0ABX8BIP0_9ACTN|nr:MULTISPECIES: pectate lyase [Nocardiopsis]QUX21595.1 right-handed parallel beta-helix repeat-containing protein [Nocardiopsis changdeensis]QYX37530.1 pectate lyase [Nocardiopsis sp. MT53]
MTARSLLAVATALALGAALAACSGGEDPAPAPASEPAQAGAASPAPDTGDESAGPSAPASDDGAAAPVGWAAQPLERDGEEFPAVTGGAAGETVTATGADELARHLSAEEPLVIEVSGGIDLDGTVEIGSDKTLVAAAGEGAELTGGRLAVDGAANVIVSGLTLDTDGTAVSVSGGAHHVWIDGNTLRDGGGDPLVSVTGGADHVTVSRNHFRDADAALSIGGREEEPGALRVSVHHNLFDGTETRSPRVRGGEVHVFNNLYRGDAEYGVESGYGAAVLVEGNYFDGFGISVRIDPEEPGATLTRDNLLVDTAQPELFGSVDDPPYAYELDDTADVPDIVSATAGAPH